MRYGEEGLYGQMTVDALYPVKPSFYLNSDVKYKGGTGVPEDPYILGM